MRHYVSYDQYLDMLDFAYTKYPDHPRENVAAEFRKVFIDHGYCVKRNCGYQMDGGKRALAGIKVTRCQ